MVFYRKYRPQTIDDLDSADVRESLSAILSSSPPPHAILFTGPKGLGKTSSARIVAKVVNCTGRKVDKEQSTKNKQQNTSKSSVPSPELAVSAAIEPCGKCESCVSITAGTNMDILEIDAASNRGIDEIRDLKEKIRLSPLSAKIKVYIIDEVHMLTTEAFNALLKTLEEPPEHAMLILCTTEQQKLPATIVSRCFHVAFKKATEDELVRSFMRIVKGEGIKVDESALRFIAGIADGAFRDGVKILEEMSGFAVDKEITKELIEEKYKVIAIGKSVDSMSQFLLERDVKSALNLVNQIVDQGIDIKYFVQSLISEVHDKLIEQVHLDQSSNIFELKQLANVLLTTHQEMKTAVLPQLPLEIAIIEYGIHGSNLSVNAEAPVIDTGTISVSSLRKEVGDIKKNQAMYGGPKKATNSDNVIVKNQSGVTLLQVPANGAMSEEWMDSLFKNLIVEMKQYNHTIAGVLRGCRVGAIDKKQLVIETNFKFHKERLDDIKTKSELARITKLLTGKDLEVIVELKKNN